MITVVIIAHNEARHLEELLPSLMWADRRLVIDDDSTDDTSEVCRKNNTERVNRSLHGDFAAQRNYALRSIKSGWVLFIDADERIDKELMESVQCAVLGQKNFGYQIRRIDHFLGKQLRFGETKNVWITRLGRVDSGVWQGKVHEVWDIAKTDKLPGTLSHYSHASVIQLFKSVNKYAKIRAKEQYDQAKYWSAWEQVAYPLAKFVQNFIMRLGFVDGWQGLLMATAMSWHSFLVRWYLWDTPWHKRSLRVTVLRYLLVLPLLLLPLGQLLRGNLNGGGGILVPEIFMALAILWGVLCSTYKIKLPSYFSQMITFSILLGFSYVISVWQGGSIRAGLYWLRWLIYVGYFSLWWDSVNSWLKVSVSGLIRYVGYGLLLGGITQYILMPDMRWLHWFGWDDHYYRMIGLLFDPNYLGLLMILFGWWVYQKEQGTLKWMTLAIVGVALLATYSRTSYLIAGLLAGWTVIRRRQFGTSMIGIIMMVVVLFFLPKPGGEGINLLRTFSFNARLQSWQTAWETGRQHPLLGIGFNQYPQLLVPNSMVQNYHPSAPDSSWLYLWATTGVMGVVAFGWMLWGWWKDGSGLVKGSLVAILLHSVMNNSFFYPWVLLWLWLLLLEEGKRYTISKN